MAPLTLTELMYKKMGNPLLCVGLNRTKQNMKKQ